MKNLLCLLIVILFGVFASAQRVHFVYFETDNAQPFYLKMDDKVYSSSDAGSFVLPNLIDSIYNLSIGFPSTSTEAKFKLAVTGKDYGYSIKNFDFGLGLFDMQSLSITRPQTDNWKSNITYQYRNDDFTSLLAKASNDTSLFYVPVVLKEDVAVQKAEPQKEEVVSVTETVRTDSSATTTADTNAATTPVVFKPEEKPKEPFVFEGVRANADTVKNEKIDVIDSLTVVARMKIDSAAENTKENSEAVIKQVYDSQAVASAPDTLSVQKDAGDSYTRSTVRRHSESSTTEGFGLVFYDIFEGGGDTIKLIIPNPKIVFKEADTTRFEDGLLEIKKDSQVTASLPVETKKAVPKSNCSATASDNDFFKLRKNMAAKESDDDMISEARKMFKNKCFSTGQIKNLSGLFLNDAARYQFFDAAYTHVTDQEVFYALQSELKDEYYLKRFKALIGE